MIKAEMDNVSPIKSPSAWIPLGMTLAALAIVVGHAAIYGVIHEADEGAAAHIWQILMVAQLPFVLYFMIKWLPKRPLGALLVLGLIGALWVANFAGVYFLT